MTVDNVMSTKFKKATPILEPDAKSWRLDAGKRSSLMVSHDPSSGPEELLFHWKLEMFWSV